MQISVEWITCNESINLPSGRVRPRALFMRHGMDFVDEQPLTPSVRGRTHTWRSYAKHAAEEMPSVTRVWVNNQLVWVYDRGWLVDIDMHEPVEWYFK